MRRVQVRKDGRRCRTQLSEYQYYEFLPIDHPLDERQRAELRALSTRARITATSFVNEYNGGDFRGNPDALALREEQAWQHVDSLISSKKPREYDAAVAVLLDLQALAERDGDGNAFSQ